MDQPYIAHAAGRLDTYRRVDLQSRILGADPHGLVLILLDEIAAAVAEMAASTASNAAAVHGAARQRALLALHGLETGLDHSAAPQLASSLSAVYRHVRGVLLDHRAGEGSETLQLAAADIAVLRESWASIPRASA